MGDWRITVTGVPAAGAVSVFLLFFVVGFAGSGNPAEETQQRRSEPLSFVVSDAVDILQHNAGTWLFLFITNTFSLGVGGLVFFAMNGYVVGTMVGLVPLEKIYYLAMFAPLEIGAFAIAFECSYRLSWACIDCLCFSRPAGRMLNTAITAGACMLGSFLMLIAAAFLETLSIVMAWG